MNFEHFFISLLTILNEMSPYILLGFIIAGVLHVYVKPSVMARHLSGPGLKPVVKAALLGIPLPLCSCGVLPTAVSLRRQGASKAAATSFLIATPQTGVDSIAATYSLLGLPFAIMRPLGALAGAMLGGIAVNKFDPTGFDAPEEAGHDNDNSCGCSDDCGCGESHEEAPSGFMGKMMESVRYGLVDMVGSVGKWLVIGLVVAALITVLVPDELFLSLSKYPVAAMLVMVAVSVPMYICATGSIPIALSLIAKGLTPGVAFVLLMAGPAANFASMMILSKTMGRKSTMIYVGSVVAVSMAFGLLIDYLFPMGWFAPAVNGIHECCHTHSFGLFESLCSALLIALLIYSGYKRKVHSIRHKHELSLQSNNNQMNKTFKIEGMACPHCQATVTKAISGVKGVEKVSVDLATGTATVEGTGSDDEIRQAVFNAGFTVA